MLQNGTVFFAHQRKQRKGGRSKKHHIIEEHKETESSYGAAKGLNQEQDKSCLPEMQRLLNSCNKYFHVNGIPHWTCVLRKNIAVHMLGIVHCNIRTC